MEEIKVGAWEMDKHGRKFRRVGNSIEYMPTITTSYGEFEMDSVPPPPENIRKDPPKTADCPFWNKCSDLCARYGVNGCGIVTGEPPTIGKRCPFGNKQSIFMCKESCNLWKWCSGKENH